MKRKFIKILPIAVAVLFATSCSKDDVDNTVKTPQEIVQENVDNTINDNVETPQEIVQENVDNTVNDNVETPQEIVQENDDNTVKTITITGKVSQESLSNEKFEFDDNTNHVWGHIDITDASGNYTAKLYFKGEGSNLVGPEFTASLNTDPNPISGPYNDLKTAVQNAYYTITFQVKKVNNDNPATGYTYQMCTSDENENLVVNIASAFIHAEAEKDIHVNGNEQHVDKDKYYVLSSSATMGMSKTDIVAGKIYKVTN